MIPSERVFPKKSSTFLKLPFTKLPAPTAKSLTAPTLLPISILAFKVLKASAKFLFLSFVFSFISFLCFTRFISSF